MMILFLKSDELFYYFDNMYGTHIFNVKEEKKVSH